MTGQYGDVERLHRLPGGGFEELVRESEGEGFRFLARLVSEWSSGRNRFGRPGEALFYEASGFRRVSGVPHATHALALDTGGEGGSVD